MSSTSHHILLISSLVLHPVRDGIGVRCGGRSRQMRVRVGLVSEKGIA